MNVVLVDLETGEILENFRGKTLKTIKQQREYLVKYNDILTNNKYGDFVWCLYDISKEYLPNIKPQNIARMMYIVSYLGYDGYLVYSNGRTITKQGIYKRLGISRTQADEFYNEMTTNNIFIEQNDKIYINSCYFCKGSINKIKKHNKNITRLYVSNVKEIYESIPIALHKHMGYIFKVIPFVNRRYNILCKNPTESTYENIQPISLNEFCNIVNYAEKHKKTIITKLCNEFYINRQHVINFIHHESKRKNMHQRCIIINPKIYYSSDDWDTIDNIGKFFTCYDSEDDF